LFQSKYLGTTITNWKNLKKWQEQEVTRMKYIFFCSTGSMVHAGPWPPSAIFLYLLKPIFFKEFSTS
jgi:hypothetical protein